MAKYTTMRKYLCTAVAAVIMSLVSGAARASVTDSPKMDKKYVGIFYFLCNGTQPEVQDKILDITKILKETPDDLWYPGNTPNSPCFKAYYWGEPLYGYYDSRDPWVICRHIELLMNAGIDYIMLDVTNARWFPDAVTPLLACLKNFTQQGLNVPKLAFYTNTRSNYTVEHVYNDFYKSGEWDGLFFCPNGKPFIVGMTEKNRSSLESPQADPISKEMLEYFDVHESQWPNAPFAPEGFPWMSWDFPQKIHDGGIISVSIAQHAPEKCCYNDTVNCRGRGYDAYLKKNIHSLQRNGLNFQNQWNTALNNRDKVNNVFVTGWNEWTAGKFLINGEVKFLDLFNEEFSRDAEMMKGGYGDNFYLQMTDNIQQFKGECGIAAQHDGVYADPQGDVKDRDFKNFDGSGKYTDTTGRNDIVRIEVSNSSRSITFRIETASDITPYATGDPCWMNILIKTDDSEGKPFEYDYVINRHPSTKTTSIDKFVAFGLSQVGKAEYSIDGHVMTVKVPIKALGLTRRNVHFHFKVADNVSHPNDIMDYYITGDSAPLGRLSFTY